MNKFKKALLIIINIFLLAACYQEYRQVATNTCRLNLQVFSQQGPSVNRTISGYVEFGSSSSNSFKGNFVEENGSSYPASFYFNGQAIHFILNMEDGQIFATGIMESNLATCAGNGGGTLTGPTAGDLGDWRGEWVATALPTPISQRDPTNSSSLSLIRFCFYLPFTIVGLFLAIFLFRLFAPYRLLALFKRNHSSTRQTTSSALRRTNQGTRSKSALEGQPLIEYLATYTADDKLFDLSFQIEKASHYLGECGVTVAKVLDAKSNQATALELWLFDTQGPQTISKILASHYCFNRVDFRSELELRGQVVWIQAGHTIILEANDLRVNAKVLQVEYETTSAVPQSVFKKVVIQIEVWPNKS